MADADNPHPTSSLSTVDKVIGIAITVLTGWAAFQSSVVKDSVAVQGAALDGLKAEIARSADDRETRKLNHEITIKIFEEVKDIYKTPNQSPDQTLNRLLAVSALVEAIPQSDVRTSLAAAVKAAADNVTVTVAKPSEEIKVKTEAVKSKIDLTVFRADQNDVSTAPKNHQSLASAANASTVEVPKWSNYDFDFFWCDNTSNPEAEKRAAELAAALKHLDPSASGRWRIRKLPFEINEKPGYRIEGYKIHVTSDDEQKIANVLKGVLKEQAIPSANADFEIKRIQYSTPWYLSVFFCPSALTSKQGRMTPSSK